MITGDKILFHQTFQNIVNNAIDAIGEGTESPLIKITAIEEDGAVLVNIADNGSGIRKEDLDRVFEPFFSTKQAGRGTGLGLIICKNIVEKHGGKITITSTAGKDTEVTVKLPVASKKKDFAPL